VVAASWGQAPGVSGVTNALSFVAGGIAPGEELSVFGANLAASTNANCYTGGVFPTTCSGTSVQINSIAVPIIFVSAGQLNLYAPLELYGGSVTLQVSTGGGTSSPFSLTVVPAAPGIATSSGLGAFLTAGSQVISTSSPASPGQVVEGFATGLGITNPQATDGAPTPASPLYRIAATVGVTVGGVPAQVAFAGLVPGEVGSYQVNFTVPAGLLGNQLVVFTADGVASPAVTLPLAAGSPSSVSVTTASSLGTFPLGEIQLGIGVSGGNGSYTWSVQNGSTLPPGLSLRGDLPAYVTPFAPEGLIGVATAPGTYNFTLSVASGANSATPSFSMKITPLTLVDGPNLPDGFVGTPYYASGYQLTATDNGASASITCTSSTSNGITLSSGCLISGSPTAAGAQTIQVKFTNGTDTVTNDRTLNVYAIRISSPGLLPNATKNTSYTYTLAAAGGTGPYTYSLTGALPAGLSLNAGVISGSPAAAEGKYNFGITVTDSASHAYTKNMAIDVIGAPEALPQILQYGDLGNCTIGVGCTLGIGVSGGGTAPFNWTVAGLPPGMKSRSGSGTTLAYVSPGDLELWGTPTALGPYNVNVQVTDTNGLSTTQIFPLNVSALLIDSCLTTAGCPGMPNGTVGTAYSSAFRVVGGVPPYTAAEAPSRSVPSGLPSGLWLSPTAVTGIPQESGQFSPLFTLTDSAGTANTLTVSETPYFNGVPGTITTVDTYPVQYAILGQPYSLQLGACCAASYSWITYPGGTPPPGLTLSSAGLASGEATTAGTYNWLVQAAQTSTGNSGTRQLTVVETPIAVTTASSLPAGVVGQTYGQPLVASGGTGSLTWSLGPGSLLPPSLTLNPASGAIGGTPMTGGSYPFNVLVSDSAGHLDLANFTVSVYTFCDLTEGGVTTVSDVQQVINEALGGRQAVHDLNHDGVVNVVDVQIEINAILGLGCQASSV
jgi:uncharacterized protein (TIGR03437 family)